MSRSERRRAARVAVVGGGNAALCAALAAHEAGAEVTVLERATRDFRGGNSRHTRNLRTVHQGADGFVTGPYPEDEFVADLVGVTGPEIDMGLATFTIRRSAEIAPWMWRHGARWQAPLAGTLGLARTNHFFLGGGKALLNAYYHAAEDRGIAIRYGAKVVGLEMEGNRCTSLTIESAEGRAGDTDSAASTPTLAVDAVVVAAGGFEANREWLREYWGDAADRFIIRGTPHNDGTMLRLLLDAGARSVGDPKAAHAIAVDARSPAYDAGIITRLDAIPIGIVVNRAGRRFYDEGEDIWPKRYATWGALIAGQPDQEAFVFYDAKVATATIPGLYAPLSAPTIAELAVLLGLDPDAVTATVEDFNRHCRSSCTFDTGTLDDCWTEGLTPPKSHWARPLDTPPFYAYPMRPGITFTYMGVAVDELARVQTATSAFSNVFAAGEIMAGNILTRGYLAGFGMTIGTVWGQIAGGEAARCS